MPELTCTLAIVTMDRFNSVVETLLQVDLEAFDQVIVIDDSTDRELQSWTEPYRIEYIRGPEENMQAARNLAIRHSDSDIISFVDDDVLLPTDFASRVRRAFMRNQDAVAVGGPCIAPTTNKAAKLCYRKRMAVSRFGTIYDDSHEWIPSTQQKVDLLHGANMSFKTQFLSKVGGFDVKYGGSSQREESDVCIRIGEYGDIVYHPELACIHKEEGATDISRSDFNWKFRNHGRFVSKNFGRIAVLGGLISIFLRPCGSPESVFQMLFRKAVLGQDISLTSCIQNYITGTRSTNNK
jgi:GT2 family glycosyltransferase